VVGNISGNSSNGLVWGCMVVAADLMIWCVGWGWEKKYVGFGRGWEIRYGTRILPWNFLASCGFSGGECNSIQTRGLNDNTHSSHVNNCLSMS